MTKDILAQYCDLQQETKDIQKRIDNLTQQIAKIESEGEVIDGVSGGAGGSQHFKIKGFPIPEYSHKRTRLYLNKAQLETAEMELLELTNQVEEYIQSLQDSRIRRIIRFKIIDGLTWYQVAMNIGGKCTEESVRKEFERFIANK